MKTIVALLIVGSMTLFANVSTAADKQKLLIATGSKGGAYYPIGRAICKFVNSTKQKSDVECKEMTSAGSILNLRAIQRNKVQFAVAQSDWQHHSYNGTSKFKRYGANKDLRHLFSLHTEPFSVVVRANSGIGQFEDLAKQRVNIGEPGSGHRGTLDAVISAMNWSYKTFASHTELPLNPSATAFCNGSIDAMVLTVGHPSKVIKDLTSKCGGVLVGVAGDTVNGMVKTHPYYSQVSIQSGIYKNMMRDVQTLGLSATLVTSAKVSEKTVYNVVKSVFTNFKKFKNAHQALKHLDKKVMGGLPQSAPVHPGAIAYFKEVGLM